MNSDDGKRSSMLSDPEKYQALADLEEEGERHEHEYLLPTISKPLMDLIPLGRFHFFMLLTCGLGWAQDNFWNRVIGDNTDVIALNFGLSDKLIGILPSVQFAGMCVGSFFWGWASDYYGRKLSFISTLFVGGIFGMAAAFAPSYALVLIFLFLVGFGAGGNLAVDGAVFSEFLPQKKRGPMLVILSTFWAFGSIVASAIDFVIIPKFNVDTNLNDRNIAWRLMIAIPATFSAYVGLLRLTYIESPVYLLGRNRDKEAAANLTSIAKWNGTPAEYTADMLTSYKPPHTVKRGLAPFKEMFKDRKMVITAGLVWSFWFLTNVGFTGFNLFLPLLLKTKFHDTREDAFKKTLIYNVAGVPGSILGAWLVETRLGRKWTMTITCLISGVFMIIFNYVGSWTNSSAVVVVVICFINFFSQIMYAAYYTYTPEVFPTMVRSSGMGVASLFGKLAGEEDSKFEIGLTREGIVTPLAIGPLLEVSVSAVLWLDFSMMIAGGICPLTDRNERKITPGWMEIRMVSGTSIPVIDTGRSSGRITQLKPIDVKWVDPQLTR
ncbi:membrane transporter [Planoprotostelium fungivorum]|uniref:Membrane transporter n=1 Tax=Planoprotostelium fungivorum TaxID=1890364 RepID=A0A2P6NJY2_9EUKA|nr:membrane transporter [Planoprotostelium fungivorum]